MRRSSLILIFLCLAVSSTVIGADSDSFWSRPDTRIVDANGQLIYAELLDRTTFTIRILKNGVWMTSHYVPNTDRLSSIEAPNERDDFTYDSDGNDSGITVHVGELSLNVKYDSRQISTSGLPTVIRDRDELQRDLAYVTQTGQLLAEVGLNKRGNVNSIRLDDGTAKYSIIAKGNSRYLQMLHGGKDNRMFERTVSSDGARRRYPYWLDPFAQELGLKDSWSHETREDASPTGHLTTISNAAGQPVLYLVRVGPDSVAFDVKGGAIFYDLSMDLDRFGSSESDGSAFQSVIPDRLVFGRNGSKGVYSSQPVADGIIGFWTWTASDGKSATSVRFGATDPNDANTSVKSVVAAPARRVLRQGPLKPSYCTLVRDTSTQICYSDGTCSGVTSTYYWACDADGSGSGTGSGSGGSTTTSGSGKSNQVSGDSILQAAVGRALTIATTKLTTAKCQALLSNNKNAAGATLLSVMTARTYSSPSSYINDGISIRNGTGVADYQGVVQCSIPVMAWVALPGNTIVRACTVMEKVSDQDRSIYLIHEMLHTLGLPEGGQYMSSTQITQMVSAACN